MCNANDAQGEQQVLFHCTHPHVVSPRRTCASLFHPQVSTACLLFWARARISSISSFIHLKLFMSRLAVALLDWRPFLVNPSRVTSCKLTYCDPRENGLSIGLQSRPPTLLEQPPTWHYIWCLHWLTVSPPLSLASLFFIPSIMHLTLRHAIYSAINRPHDIPTATFMLLPCWGRSMSTNAYIAFYIQPIQPHICSLMGTISSQNLQYAGIPFWNDSCPLPKHHWDLQIIAVWNTQARLH